jgi:hypothetical protein
MGTCKHGSRYEILCLGDELVSHSGLQVAHTLLQLIDGDTGQQIKSPQRRMAVFVSNLRSALPQTFDWLLTSDTTAAISLSSKAGSHVRRGDYMFSLLFVTHIRKCAFLFMQPFFFITWYWC